MPGVHPTHPVQPVEASLRKGKHHGCCWSGLLPCPGPIFQSCRCCHCLYVCTSTTRTSQPQPQPQRASAPTRVGIGKGRFDSYTAGPRRRQLRSPSKTPHAVSTGGSFGMQLGPFRGPSLVPGTTMKSMVPMRKVASGGVGFLNNGSPSARPPIAAEMAKQLPVGSLCWYRDHDGSAKKVYIAEVNREVIPPKYYITIDGRKRESESLRLTLISPPQQKSAPAAEKAPQQHAQAPPAAAGHQAPSQPAAVATFPACTNAQWAQPQPQAGSEFGGWYRDRGHRGGGYYDRGGRDRYPDSRGYDDRDSYVRGWRGGGGYSGGTGGGQPHRDRSPPRGSYDGGGRYSGGRRYSPPRRSGR